MSTQSHTHTPHALALGQPPASAPLLPLETGDSLSRDEFERRYEAMPDLKKAELIEGVVYFGSPVSPPHLSSHALLMTWLGLYATQTLGVDCADNGRIRLDLLNEAQPDAFLRTITGGQSKIDPRTKYIEGPPELVAEIASSSVSRELHSKLRLYYRHGVREYLVWRVLDEDFDWFKLESNGFERLCQDETGVIRSDMFAGLWLDKAALVRGDMATVLAVLNRGLASLDHAALVAQLAR